LPDRPCIPRLKAVPRSGAAARRTVILTNSQR
jgi:hypothetical protein